MNSTNSSEGFQIPKVIFGTSSLGNLFTALDDDTKLEIVKQCFLHADKPVVFDSAGKYGAGLALEALGDCLKKLNVKPEEVIISNKLGWLRTELKTDEPTFEPYVWKNLKNDAVQKISYHGILECFEQGNQLLGSYIPQMLSVHDPDEYLIAASSAEDRSKRYQNILDAYKALFDLKKQGKVKAIGIGAKDWKIIKELSADLDFDWVMIANSMTVYSHPKELLDFMTVLSQKGVIIINSAVFNAGFLTGGDFYNYVPVSRDNPQHQELFKWRDQFYKICADFDVKPASACVQFGLSAPGVKSIALNTSNPKRVEGNIAMANDYICDAFWQKLEEENLITLKPSLSIS
ncbi:aldo/keto reductase [Pedobacter aquae]|uniref:Aldo/keto reductase n=1 Tax=Pedobacter aquae TaxID=2605747 RepID=A0A5C0VE88_9SPHI|nr:aldo/keto reductase [Pedobacter aquae]QEK50379.1 aldo/keto reductase [Pedobacter aquae]